MERFQKPFKPTPWLWSRHMHGVLCVFFRSPVNLEYKRDKVQTKDGSYIYIDWAENKNTKDDAPIVIVLPGAAGNSQSVYVTQFIKHIVDTKGYRAAVMVYQGCDLTTKINTPRFVVVEDVIEIINYISSKYKKAPIIALGHSFGATLLVKYLGIVKENTPLLAALSLSNPWNLGAIAKNIKEGLLTRGYELHILDEFKRIIQVNKDMFEKTGKFYDGLNAKTVAEFHENFCCPVHGFDNLNMYYMHYNSDSVLENVKIPLFVLHALDDPIVPSYAIPVDKLQKNPYIFTGLTSCGGHTGWLEDWWPTGLTWLDRVCVDYIEILLKNKELVQSKRSIK